MYARGSSLFGSMSTLSAKVPEFDPFEIFDSRTAVVSYCVLIPGTINQGPVVRN